MKAISWILAAGLCWLAPSPACAVTEAPTLQSKAGMVTAAHPLAARAGAEILEKGGNAVDAAIAVSLALGVVEPYASGMGGEGYLVAVMADGRELAVDFRSTAPAMATYANLEKAGRLSEVRYTAKGYCVAGVPAGIGEALKYASLSLADLAAPAIRLAEEGFTVSETFSAVNMDRWEVLYANAPDFLNDGMPWSAGETYRNPALAKTLRTMVGQGVDSFYSGELADSLDRFMRENDGWARKSDLAAYRAIARKPVKGLYRGYEINLPGSPVGGPRVLATLNILEHFNLGIMDWDDPLAIHLMQEAMILTALDQRRWIGDPLTNKSIPESGFVSKEYARERLMLIDLAQASDPGTWAERVGNPTPYENGASYVDVMLAAGAAVDADPGDEQEPASTTHFSVVDRHGNAVAWTQTISSFFGTGHMVDGYFLNNELGNFKSRPVDGSPINLEPGRRPRTTIAPMVVTKDGELRWVLGSPGAGRIGSTLIEILVNVIDFGMDLEDAIRAPKFTGYDVYREIQLEDEFPEKTVAFLEAMGHQVKEYDHPDLYFGGPNAIEVGADGTLTGVGSIRRNGGAAAPDPELDIRPGPGVTARRMLSDYFAPLAGGPLDTPVFVLDSGKPGATGLMIGGTHGNELAGQVAALLALENVEVREGRLLVVPYANRSAITVRDTRLNVEQAHAIETPAGPRVLLYGDRRTDPADQGEADPAQYTNPPGYTLEEGAEARNLNRTWPGDPEGTPTEQLSHALIRLIREEGVDFSLDMHEADTPERKEVEDGDYRPGGNRRLAYTLVSHPRGLEVAAFALLAMEADTGISMKLEESNSRYRGLSHLEIGDSTAAVSFLSESPNPGQDRWREDPDVVSDPKYPLEHRAGLHLRLFKHLADAWGESGGESLLMDGLPAYDELMESGVGRFLGGK